jgi:hypothetical protein
MGTGLYHPLFPDAGKADIFKRSRFIFEAGLDMIKRH